MKELIVTATRARTARGIAGLLVAGLFVAGCDAPAPATTALPSGSTCLTNPALPFVAVVGTRANSPAATMPGVVEPLLDETNRSGTPVKLIRVDGKPELVYDRAFDSTAKNEPAKNNDYQQFFGDLQRAFATDTRAKTAEADPLTALTLAARSTPHGANVILLDSGLQTVAPLRFQDDNGALLNAEPGDVVAHLKKLELLPNLTGKHVLLAGIGNVVDPQQQLNQRLHNQLIAIWRAIVEEGGATCVEVVDTPARAPKPLSDVPSVATVPVPPPPPQPQPCGVTVLNDNNDVGFRPNQDVFVDEEAAKKTIGQVADVMRDGRQRAELIGTTANVGNYDGQVELSKRRAEAVRRTLVELGVAADRLSTTGLGSRFSDYQQDHGPGGVLLPGPAANNRKVIVRLNCTS